MSKHTSEETEVELPTSEQRHANTRFTNSDLKIEKIAKIPPPPTPIEQVPGDKQEFLVRRIYFDDFQAIYMTLDRQCSNIQFETDDYRFQVPDQLKQLPQDRISLLKISAANPAIEIDARPGRFTLQTFENSDAAKALFFELRSVLNKRKSRILRWVDEPAWAFATLALWSGLMLLPLAIFSDRQTQKHALAVVIAGFLIWVMGFPFAFKYWFKSTDVVLAYTKRERPRPWYLSDTMKITLVSVILTSIFTAFITYMLAKGN